ncbi:MAG: cell division protein ZipA C-terminal FtsZ-binding domain-containing protein [Casimicrobiaceae bacterium]
MRIFSLQFGLIVAGIVLVVGVLLYNHWVLRRARAMRDCARLVESPSESTRVEPSLHVMQAGPASDEPRDQPVAASAPEAMVVAESISGGGGTPDNAFPADDAARWQIPMDDVASLPSVPTPTRGRDDVQRGTYRDTTHTQPDPDIECVVVLRPAAPVGVHALAAGLHARLGKPLRWFGHRDASTAWQRLGVDSAGEFAEIAGCLLLADRNGAAGRNQIDAFLRLVGDLAPTLPATFTTRSVDDETARAEALDRLCAELDMQIGITIQKTDGSAIAGTRLRGVAEASGFRLAPSGRFEWVQEETGNVVYTLQNMSGEPFSLEGLRTATLTGIVFVLDVPCVADPARAFDQMKLAAGRLARTVGGEMVDDNRRILADGALATTRAAVVSAAAALADVHIEPGSPRALKLFSA